MSEEKLPVKAWKYKPKEEETLGDRENDGNRNRLTENLNL
jgi:hypothetical protein